MSCPDYLAAIGDLVDDALDGAEADRVERHLRECAACRELAAGLRRLRSAARALGEFPPPPGGWEALARRIQADPELGPRVAADGDRSRMAWMNRGAGGRQRRHAGWRSPPWLAAAAALLLVVASSLWLLRMADLLPGAGRPPADPPGLVESIETELRLAEQHYDKAIRGLEEIAGLDESAPLDPQLVATLRKTLGIIDEAIAESRTALRADPTNRLARESLFEALRRKVALLQDTIALMNEMRKGNQAGAARIAEGFEKS